MTLKELRQRFEATIKAKQERAAEIDRLKKELNTVESNMLDAADRGDLDNYKVLDDKKRDIEARIFVYTRSLPSAGNPVTREEVIASWEAFVKTYNKDIKKQYDAYLADCRALAFKYKQLANVQNAALYEREKALQIMGEDRNSQALEMYLIPSSITEQFVYWGRISPELAFFEGKGFFTRDESVKINQVIADGVAAAATDM